jgi:hypothetical protein
MIFSPLNTAPMKHILIIVAALACVLPVYSQSSESYSDKNNELNIGFFNAFELNNFSDLGIGYKRLAKHGAWRFGTGFAFSLSDSDDEIGAMQTHTYYSISPRAGYEWHQNFNRIQLQYGTDLVINFYKSVLEDTNESIDYYRYQERRSTKYSIRPFLGVKVFVTKSISISTETFLDVGYTKETFKEDYNSTTTTRNEKGTSMTLGPLGVFSINFHF